MTPSKSIYFFPTQSVFSISTSVVFIPYQIWIPFEIHTETLGTSALLSYGAPWCSSPPLFWFSTGILYRTEMVKTNKMELHVILYYRCPIGNGYSLFWWQKKAKKNVNFSPKSDSLWSTSLLKIQAIKPIIILLLVLALTPVNTDLFLSYLFFSYFTS